MTREEIHNMIRDYYWIINEIKLLKSELNDTDASVTTQYGTESVMPKAKGSKPDTMTFEIIRRDKQSKRVEQLESKVKFIQDNMHKITDERQRVILDHLLDGMSITKLAHHMGVSRKKIYQIKDEIIDLMVSS